MIIRNFLRPSTRRLTCINRLSSTYLPATLGCRISTRFNSSLVAQEKPFYITSPIFYVNAAPHIGHLYTLILCDILKRWQVLRGREAIFCTGTDEHGMKIQRAAENAEVETKAFCDQNAEIFKSLADSLDLSHDYFIRTTDTDHRFAVQHFWMMLRERGFIYESKHSGWYSVSDETFYPESAVERALNPSTGKVFMASVETGKEVEWTEEYNYHFKLSHFREPLLKFYKENPKFIVPESRMQEIVKQVENGLSDLSISRPVERLSWGIPVPDDETQTIYVWLDALINYLVKAGYPFQLPGSQGIWPADVQVIGKDITRFHCIYWPAFLMALDLPPPKQILTHAHWTLGKRKMAKSTGNVVDPFFAIDRFGIDPLRYYMAYDGGIRDDADYENSFVTARYKKNLFGGVGSLASRIVRSKMWTLEHVMKYTNLKAAVEASPTNAEMADIIRQLPDRIDKHFTDLDSGAAVKEINKAIFQTNSFFSQAEPWKLIESDRDTAWQTVYLTAESLRICGILLQPFMPNKMSTLLDMLGVVKTRRMFKDAVLGVDQNYGKPLAGTKLGNKISGALFPPLLLDWGEPARERS